MKSSRDARVDACLLDSVARWPGGRADLEGGSPNLRIDVRDERDLEPLRVSARRVDSWLLLESDVATASLPANTGAFSALERFSSLPGGLKLALVRPAGTPRPASVWRLRAELLVEDDAGFDDRVSAALEAFASAAGVGSLADSPSRDLREADALRADCATRIAKAGFTVGERGDGSWWVDLATDHGFVQAELIADARGARLVCDLASFEPASQPRGAEAAACVCLLANAAVRLAGAGASAGRDLRAEVALGAAPGDATARAAVEALSVFVAAAGNECQLLADCEEIAERYLARARPRERATDRGPAARTASTDPAASGISPSA